MVAHFSKAANHYPVVTLVDGQQCEVDRDGIRDRQRSTRPPTREEVKTAARWLFNRAIAIKTPTISSYTAKHAAERYCRSYIPNGAMIVAADRLGICQRLAHWNSLNTKIAISRRGFRLLPESTMHHEECSR
ncbi:hypothetical protein Pan14r_06410 [Crateriforma conspicua]|uniref:Uncharacterized protein n=1 Tax=Crateriforma conspicua TaxID=2527996 RepID=A0A5C5XYB0_9PLAN|nr:hypothetical protein Pan14r_06410 [Crateriforma conspicua]